MFSNIELSCVSAHTGDGYCTSGVCLWVWGPPAASAERCGINGKWKLHTPVWLHRRTRMFQLEVLESCAVPGDSRLQDTNLFKTQDAKWTSGMYCRLSEDASTSPLLLGDLICQVRWLPINKFERAQGPLDFFHREVNFVYRDIYLVLNNLMFSIIYIQCFLCFIFVMYFGLCM